MSRIYVLVISALLIFALSVQAQDRCTGKAMSQQELTICSNPQLRQLDEKLNMVFGSAMKATANVHALRASQRTWLKAVRNRCEGADCLGRAYRARTIELTELLMRSVKLTHGPLSRDEAWEVCSSLAAVADSKSLTTFAIPGIEQGSLDTSGIPSRWTISPVEKEKLKAKNLPWTSEPSVVYSLQLTRRGSPKRFASFFTGGTCPSYQIFSIPFLLNAEEGNVELAYGSDILRWAYWNGGDYPIIYRGRYFMITARLDNSNRPEMVSWIEPDGTISPMCLLETKIAKRTVVTAKNKALCVGIASGTIHPLEWQPMDVDLPYQDRDEFVRRFGDFAESVRLLRVDIDGKGVAKNIGRFEYSSSAGCGGGKTWLSVLSNDLSSVSEDRSNEVFRKLSGGPMDIFHFQGTNYFHAIEGSHKDGVVRFVDGKLEEVCEFGEETSTEVSRFSWPE